MFNFCFLGAVNMSIAIVIGSSGGIGEAVVNELLNSAKYDQIIEFCRPQIDLQDESTIQKAAEIVPQKPVTLIINATGYLHDFENKPEKSLRELSSAALQKYFVINAIGPALLMKYFLPLLPRHERAVFANISARVGSIEDNRLGGWYGYRASKAALNQFTKTAAIELGRTHPEAVCVALHPGTVETRLSAPYVASKYKREKPNVTARHLLAVISNLNSNDTGKLFDWRGERIPW